MEAGCPGRMDNPREQNLMSDASSPIANMVPTPADLEFARQAIGERALTRAQIDECMGAQLGFADQGIQRALPVITCGLGMLERRRIEKLMRHVIRRSGPMPIGPYECLRQVGRGGMGIVFRALQEPFGRTVALKLLLRERMDERATSRFQHEARASARIRHQNIVAALDIGEADGWHYFAMEYVAGKTLSRAVAEKGSLPDWLAVHITAQVAAGLAHAHDAGVIHRDVKPSNILIAKDATAKLCDLGLSQLAGVDESHLHQKRITVGSRRFISPEQARGLEDLDERTDIYSLGLCLYYMIAGALPFADVPERKVMREHAKGHLPWPANVNPTTSDAVSWLITRMSALDRAQRYTNAHELHEDLCALRDRLRPSNAPRGAG